MHLDRARLAQQAAVSSTPRLLASSRLLAPSSPPLLTSSPPRLLAASLLGSLGSVWMHISLSWTSRRHVGSEWRLPVLATTCLRSSVRSGTVATVDHSGHFGAGWPLAITASQDFQLPHFAQKWRLCRSELPLWSKVAAGTPSVHFLVHICPFPHTAP